VSPESPYVSVRYQEPSGDLNSPYPGAGEGGLTLLCLSGGELAVGGLAPETVDIDHVLTDACDRYLQKTLALGCLEEGPLFLGQPMPNATIADFAPGRLAATESLDVILVGLGHREEAKAEEGKRK